MSILNTVPVAEFMDASRSAFTATLRRAGRKHSVLLRLHGNTAAIDIQPHDLILIMPSMPLTARLSRAEADRMIGYWLHELGHALHSTPGLMESTGNAFGRSVARMLNALEDPRQEAELIATGHAPNATATLQTLIAHLCRKARTDGWNGSDLRNAGWTIAAIARAEINGMDLPEAREVRAELSPGLASIVDYAIRAIRAASREDDLVEPARWIVSRLRELDARPQDQGDQPQPGQGQGQDGDQGDQDGDQGNQGQDGESGTESGDQDQPDQGQDQDESGQSERSQGDQGDDATQASGGDAGGLGDFEVSDAEPSIADTIQDVRDRAPDDVVSDMDQRDPGYAQAIRERIAAVLQSRGVPQPAEPGRSVGPTMLRAWKGVIPAPNRLKADLAELVKAPARALKDRNQRAGRLSRRDIGRAAAGQSDVFIRTRIEEGQDALIWFLIDLSGSMNGTRLPLARALALHMCEGIERHGGRCAVLGFRGFHASRLDVFKPESERLRNSLSRWRKMTAGGGTPLSSAMASAARRMRLVPATRRILVVLTDGACGSGQDVSQGVAEAIQDAGHVELVALALDSAPVRGVEIQESMSSWRTDEIGKRGLGAIVKALRQGRRRAA